MSRMTIDSDDELVAAVMCRYGKRTTEDAVDFALRRLVGPVMIRDDMLGLRGSGWSGDLDDLRSDRVESSGAGVTSSRLAGLPCGRSEPRER